MSFKLIAIRPLGETDDKLLKNLGPLQVYQFYNEYQFHFIDGDNQKDVVRIEQLSQSVPEKSFRFRTFKN